MFDCDTGPPFPGLSTRTGAFSFDAPIWNVSPSANASCSFFAAWPMTCNPGPLCGLGRILLGRVQVPCLGVRRRLVRLRDGTVVAGAQDPDADVLVRGLHLHCRGESPRLLVVVSELTDRPAGPPWHLQEPPVCVWSAD